MSEKFTRREFLQSACISVGALATTAGATNVFAGELPKGNENGLPSVDVLIIGSGGAGLRAATAVRKQYPNSTVVVATKMMPSRNATCMAEGGINGVTDFSNGDSFKLHAYDTVKGAAYLADQDAVVKFCEAAGAVIHELDYNGMLFSRKDNGDVAFRFMGGASKKRCNYAADKTGHVLMHACLDDAITAGVKFLMDHELLEIGLEDGKVEGVVLRNIQDGQIYPVLCKSLVIATGGYTRIFYNRTSVPFIATGDGIAAALKVGLGFEDPEMLQFHPTGVQNGGTLITEAARGEGGYLLNKTITKRWS